MIDIRRNVRHLPIICRIIPRIIRHRQHLPRIRIQHHRTQIRKPQPPTLARQNLLHPMLQILVQRQHHILPVLRRNPHILIPNGERDIIHVLHGFQQTIRPRQPLIQRPLHAILSLPLRIHKPQHRGRQRPLRIYPLRITLQPNSSQFRLRNLLRRRPFHPARHHIIPQIPVRKHFIPFRHQLIPHRLPHHLCHRFLVCQHRVHNHRINRRIQHHRRRLAPIHHINLPPLRRQRIRQRLLRRRLLRPHLVLQNLNKKQAPNNHGHHREHPELQHLISSHILYYIIGVLLRHVSRDLSILHLRRHRTVFRRRN